MFNSNCNTASVPLVANIDGNGNNGAWGDGSWLWFIIVIFAIFGGCGNGFGWGGNNGRDGYLCATQADVRAAVDQQTLISKLDQQTYGLADTFTALNNTLNSNFRGIDNAICTLGYQNQQGFSNLSAQLASCCCETGRAIERGFADTNYNMATQACDIKHAISDSTRQVLDFLTTDKIATLQAENQNLKLKASQAEQNTYLVNALRPCPIPAYNVPNPFCCYGYQQTNTCGCC